MCQTPLYGWAAWLGGAGILPCLASSCLAKSVGRLHACLHAPVCNVMFALCPLDPHHTIGPKPDQKWHVWGVGAVFRRHGLAGLGLERRAPKQQKYGIAKNALNSCAISIIVAYSMPMREGCWGQKCNFPLFLLAVAHVTKIKCGASFAMREKHQNALFARTQKSL